MADPEENELYGALLWWILFQRDQIVRLVSLVAPWIFKYKNVSGGERGPGG